MDRKKFIQVCGMGCIGAGLLPAFLESCAVLKITDLSGEIIDSDLVVPLESFVVQKKDKKSYKSHIVVRHEKLKYPISVFRDPSGEFKAYLMRCTHQGTELQLYGDRFQCPAHGSEFTVTGKVLRGPAGSDLRSFPVVANADKIKICLK